MNAELKEFFQDIAAQMAALGEKVENIDDVTSIRELYDTLGEIESVSRRLRDKAHDSIALVSDIEDGLADN